jgi:hypothetical protein
MARSEELYKAGKDSEVKALVNKYGDSKLKYIAGEHYEALLKEVDSIYLN